MPAQEHIWHAGGMHSGSKVDPYSWKDSVVTNTAQKSKSRLKQQKSLLFFDQIQCL